MSNVNLKNVRKVYPNGHVAVSDANLEIEAGEFIILVGPSGCGKSTLLRMIAGLEDITAGTISIGGRAVNDVSPRERNISMVFQNYALYPHMTVAQNMGFALKQAGMDKGEIKRRVADAADILGLDKMLDRKPKQLSGGQRQRVAVGRAIVRDADVFLFDEPLSNLDASLRNQMRTEIAKLHKRLGKTMIYVTHDQVEAMTMGDRIVVLKDGDVLQFDRPLDVYKAPVNRFVAGFIGSPAMNTFVGRINGSRSAGSGTSFLASKGSLTIPCTEGIVREFRLQPGADVEFGIRPEDIHVGSEDSPVMINADLHVELVEPMGNETIIHGRLGGSDGESTIARCRIDALPATGDVIPVRLDTSRSNFFDSETGQSLRQ